MPGRGFFRSNAFAGSACAVWLAIVGCGFAVLHRYEATPGRASAPSPAWPKDSPIPLEEHRLTMVLALHPRCPCSTATIGELEELLARHPGRAALNVLLYKPANQPDDWTTSRSSQTLARWADTRLWIDEEGREAARVGALTSGHLLIYDADGRLCFSGGITPGRGRYGASAGSEAVAAVLDGLHGEWKQTPVYGCSLLAAPLDGRGESRCPRDLKIAQPKAL